MRREIIEFGLVEWDPGERRIVREGRWLVRPRESVVGTYCTALTGITHDEARAQGRPLGEVVRTIAKAFGTLGKPSLAWGDDWEGIERECARVGAPNPFRREGFVNAGLVYGLMAGTETRPGLAAAAEALGVGRTGRAHSALDDARDALLVFEAMSAACGPSRGFSP